KKTTVMVVSKADGTAVRGATVVAFTDFAQRQGAQGKTNRQGDVSLRLGSSHVDRLYVYPQPGFSSLLKKNFTALKVVSFKLTPLDLKFVDCLRHFYGQSALDSGQGVTVGVMDTGIGPHNDLTVDGGANTLTDENETDFGDNGEGHGTHVGGII